VTKQNCNSHMKPVTWSRSSVKTIRNRIPTLLKDNRRVQFCILWPYLSLPCTM
jgi:hypothetical protein